MSESEQAYVERINALSDDELATLVSSDQCPYEPERLQEALCPLCGEMVLTSVPHPRQRNLP